MQSMEVEAPGSVTSSEDDRAGRGRAYPLCWGAWVRVRGPYTQVSGDQGCSPCGLEGEIEFRPQMLGCFFKWYVQQLY